MPRLATLLGRAFLLRPEPCMKKLIAVHVLSGSIALFTVGCAEQPAAPPHAATPSRPLLGADTPFNNTGQCLFEDALTWHELVLGIDEGSTVDEMNCTSNDVGVTRIVATQMLVNGVWVPLGPDPITCTEGEQLTLRLNATLRDAGAGRTDVGFWLATDDDGDALEGSCHHYNLPVTPLPDGVSDLDGDSCGDMTANASASVDLGEVSVVCTPGSSGQLEIGTCVAWGPEVGSRVCPEPSESGPNAFRAGTLPGTVARCNCQPVVIETAAPTTGSITIVKDALPDDAQDFSFTTSGTGLSSFSLDDDANPTLPNTSTFSGLAPGTYAVVEALTPGFDVTAITCTAGGAGTTATRTATISLAAGASVTCTFANTKRATVQVSKVENNTLSFSRTWAFEIRTGASTATSGTVLATGTAEPLLGAVTFACTPNSAASCENVGGVATFVPGTYQLCEVNIPAGYTNNITSPPGFTPGGATPEGGADGTECMSIVLAKGDVGVPSGVPNPINNIAPPASGGSIALQTGSFTLVNDALSGSFAIRNSSGGAQQVFVTGLAVVTATFRDGPNLVQATVSGCGFSPLPALIPGGGSQAITLTGCQVSPSVRKELTFTVRAEINDGDQPFYTRTYKVRVQ